MIRRPNIVFILSDEHEAGAAGCYGSSVVKTPNLDALAFESLVFDNAYCTNPICVPARMSLFTGRHSHEINSWDNDSPLSGHFPTYASYLQAEGYDTTACGRTHFIGTARNYGFNNRLLDDLIHWKHLDMVPVKREPGLRRKGRVTDAAGEGTNVQIDYDDSVCDLTKRFLRSKAKYPGDAPWLLYSGFINPHFPLITPEKYLKLYDPDTIPLPTAWNQPLEEQHHAIRQLRTHNRFEDIDESHLRTALCAYYGLVSYTDDLVGRIVDSVLGSTLADDTVIIYMSDHGEMGGQHGLWQKCCFYDGSARAPLMIRIPGGPKGRVKENVSFIDVLPTLLDLAGAPIPEWCQGESVLRVAERDTYGERTVYSQYHANGSIYGYFMAKRGDWKYNYYVSHGHELYNLSTDPNETNDLSSDPAHSDTLDSMHGELMDFVDPVAVDAAARENQQVKGHRRGYVNKMRKPI